MPLRDRRRQTCVSGAWRGKAWECAREEKTFWFRVGEVYGEFVGVCCRHGSVWECKLLEPRTAELPSRGPADESAICEALRELGQAES